MKLVIPMALALALTACTATRGTFCAVANPIVLSSATIDALTEAEARDALAHNLKGQSLCGWKP